MPASSKTSRRDAPAGATLRADRAEDAGSDDAYFGETVALWAISLFVLIIAAGFFAFRQAWPIEHGNEMSVDRALFTSINAATLTGFEQRTAVDHYKIPGQCVVMLETI